jgi:hypothetical protein
MSTPPNEKATQVPPGASALPEARKITADSIDSDSDGSHQYGTGDVFAQGGQFQYYEPIAEYEGRHRYDPAAQWTDGEEKRLIRRVCTYIWSRTLSSVLSLAMFGGSPMAISMCRELGWFNSNLSWPRSLMACNIVDIILVRRQLQPGAAENKPGRRGYHGSVY